MQLYLYQFSKYRNSTKRPDQADGTQVVGEFKTGYSILHPVVKLSRDVISGRKPGYNYATIPSTGYYYFIRNWVYESGFWFAYLDYDPLASWKPTILQRNYYVLRCSTDFNGDIIDTTYATTASRTFNRSSSVNYPWMTGVGANGCFVIGIINDIAWEGCITYYVCSYERTITLFNKLMSSISWANISATEISQQLQKALINPLQYVASLTWLPFDLSDISGLSTDTLKVGWWEIDTGSWNTIRPRNALLSKTVSLTIPKHPKSGSRGNYLNLSPYSSYTLNFYPFGSFELDTTALSGVSTLYLHIACTLTTGEAVLYLSPTTDHRDAFRVSKGQLGISIPTAQININLASITSGASLITAGLAGASAASSAMTGSPNLGKIPANTQNPNAARARAAMLRGEIDYAGSDDSSSVADVAANAGSAAMAALSTVEYHPASGSYADMHVPITLIGKFLDVVDAYPSYIGRPLCAYRNLGDLWSQAEQQQISSVFVKCELAWPSFPGATMQEQEDIASYLNGGFYIE